MNKIKTLHRRTFNYSLVKTVRLIEVISPHYGNVPRNYTRLVTIMVCLFINPLLLLVALPLGLLKKYNKYELVGVQYRDGRKELVKFPLGTYKSLQYLVER